MWGKQGTLPPVIFLEVNDNTLKALPCRWKYIFFVMKITSFKSTSDMHDQGPRHPQFKLNNLLNKHFPLANFFFKSILPHKSWLGELLLKVGTTDKWLLLMLLHYVHKKVR